MRFGRILSIYVCLIMTAVCLPAAEDVAAEQSWKIGHVRPSGSAIDKDVHRFVAQIAADTGQKITFDVYPGSRLGDYSVVQERVSFGEVEMYVGPFATAIDRRVMLAFTPKLVDTWEAAKKIYAPDSLLMKNMAKFMAEQNIKILGGWPVYFGGIAFTRKPIQVENPDVSKEMIIRVPPIRSFELTARALGFTPYPITWTYARMGLKTGMVDGIMGGGADGYIGLGKKIRYYLPVKDHFEYWFVYMNLDRWEKLSAPNRKHFMAAARAMESRRYDVAPAHEKESLKQLEKQGVEILQLDEIAQKRMKEKIRSQVWPLLKKDIGTAFDTVVNIP